MQRQLATDADCIFGGPGQTCDLVAMFGEPAQELKLSRFRTRKDTGDWRAQQLTRQSEASYRSEVAWAGPGGDELGVGVDRIAAVLPGL